MLTINDLFCGAGGSWLSATAAGRRLRGAMTAGDPGRHEDFAMSNSTVVTSAPPLRDHTCDSDSGPAQRARDVVDQLRTRRSEPDQPPADHVRTEQMNRWHRDDRHAESVDRSAFQAADATVDGREAAR